MRERTDLRRDLQRLLALRCVFTWWHLISLNQLLEATRQPVVERAYSWLGDPSLGLVRMRSLDEPVLQFFKLLQECCGKGGRASSV